MAKVDQPTYIRRHDGRRPQVQHQDTPRHPSIPVGPVPVPAPVPMPAPGPVPVPAPASIPMPTVRASVVQPSKEPVADVQAIIVSFNTLHLTREAFASLRQAYPDLPITLIDNASKDGSSAWANDLRRSPHVDAISNRSNVGHGPAMHQGIIQAQTKFVLLMDSDCVVLQAGFLEAMLARFSVVPQLYAVGWQRIVDKVSGVPLDWHVSQPPSQQFCAYIHPSCALIDRDIYLKLPPFMHHGAPAIANMRAAVEAGYVLEAFPVSEYVTHMTAGTRRLYGGRWDPGTDDVRGPWRASDKLPI